MNFFEVEGKDEITHRNSKNLKKNKIQSIYFKKFRKISDPLPN